MRRFVIIVVFMFLGACEDKPFADLNTTASFSQYGVAFDYPGNWELSESDAGVKDGAKLHVMTLRTPSGAFMTIQSFEERMKLKVEDWAERLCKDYERRFAARSQVLETGSREAAQRTFMGETRDGLRQGFTVIDGERSASLSAELFVAEFPGGTSTVLIQGSADDFERGKAGFEHVLASLKWTRPAPDREIPTIDIIAPPNAEGKPDLEKATVVVNQGGAASKAPGGEGEPSGEKGATKGSGEASPKTP